MSGHDPRDDYDDEPWKRRANPDTLVHWPAALMSAIALIQLGFSAICFVWLPVVLVWSWFDPDYFDNDVVWYEMVLGTLAAAVCIVINWLAFRGAVKLRTFKNYRFVVVSVILSALSLPFFYCGLLAFPVAIWAIVILLHPDVRARFETVARGKMNTGSPMGSKDRG
jgi:hypothetical protein